MTTDAIEKLLLCYWSMLLLESLWYNWLIFILFLVDVYRSIVDGASTRRRIFHWTNQSDYILSNSHCELCLRSTKNKACCPFHNGNGTNYKGEFYCFRYGPGPSRIGPGHVFFSLSNPTVSEDVDILDFWIPNYSYKKKKRRRRAPYLCTYISHPLKIV